MSSVEYDLDTSSGLMPQIQALIAPPVSDDGVKKTKKEKESTYYRRPGRSVNHDCCDSCKEGGDLLCCDRCPAAFHLKCHDPPLDEEDLPSGDWVCHRCKMIAKEFGVIKRADGVENPPSFQPTDSSQTSTESNDHVSSNCDSIGENLLGENETEMETKPAEESEDESPFHMLIRAATFMNPKQFQLPPELHCTTLLPGTSKRPQKKDGNKNNVKKVAHELDNGVVPLPAKVCFECRKSCRKAPLIQCDYCPLLFHQDCLNPPLTTMPSSRWMCPNHAENLLDQKLLTSVSLTERVKLWDKFSGHVSQDAVKIAFLQRIHRSNPPFRYKVKLPPRNRIQVPQAIKDQYKHPFPLLPRITEAPVLTTLSNPEIKYSASTEEQEEWLGTIVSLQLSLAQHMAQKQITVDGNSCEESPGVAAVPYSVCLTAPTMTTPTMATATMEMTTEPGNKKENDFSLEENSDKDDDSSSSNHFKSRDPLSPEPYPANCGAELITDSTGDQKVKTEAEDDAKMYLGSLEPNNISDHMNEILLPCLGKLPTDNDYFGNPQTNNSSLEPLNAEDASEIRTHVLESLSSSPISSVKLSANKIGICQISSAGSSTKVTPTGKFPSTITNPTSSSKSVPNPVPSSSPSLVSLNSSLQLLIEGSRENEMDKLDERLVHILAWQRLQQLLPSKNSMLANTKSPNTNSGSKTLQARATLCPLTGKGPTVSMIYRVLSIGTGADMDVCLASFGFCNYVSAKHASVFFDETTKHYELLNYSEHGTTVDNVLYSCDFSDKNVTNPVSSSVAMSVRNIIGQTQERSDLKWNVRPTINSKILDNCRSCNCKASSSSLIGGSGAGWEGTALLHHGSYIKCGCLQFVFSITDYNTEKKT